MKIQQYRGGSPETVASVTKYSMKTGLLYLEYSQPATVPKRLHKQPHVVVAVVDIALLLETLKTTDTQIGEWVNVVAYVNETCRDGGRTEVMVQALMLWSAGAINTSEYEATVEHRKNYEQSHQGLKRPV